MLMCAVEIGYHGTGASEQKWNFCTIFRVQRLRWRACGVAPLLRPPTSYTRQSSRSLLRAAIRNVHRVAEVDKIVSVVLAHKLDKRRVTVPRCHVPAPVLALGDVLGTVQRVAHPPELHGSRWRSVCEQLEQAAKVGFEIL